jgi:hypothetical protein
MIIDLLLLGASFSCRSLNPEGGEKPRREKKEEEQGLPTHTWR